MDAATADAAGGVRFDLARSYFPEAQVGPTRFLPTPIVFAETTGVDSYKDISPAAAWRYDVFGNGKTSIKVNVGRYLEAAQNGGNYSGPRPTGRITSDGHADMDRCEPQLRARLQCSPTRWRTPSVRRFRI